MVVVELTDYRAGREAAELALRTAAKTRDIEEFITMMESVASTLKAHGVRRMTFRDCAVMDDGTPVPRIIARASKACPNCGSRRKRYMQTGFQGTKRDYVVWGCLKCGSIYGRWEDNEPLG
ncbi:MAG: hypothetical protein ACPL5F_10500 [Moorellaceae bacterium]